MLHFTQKRYSSDWIPPLVADQNMKHISYYTTKYQIPTLDSFFHMTREQVKYGNKWEKSYLKYVWKPLTRDWQWVCIALRAKPPPWVEQKVPQKLQ